MRGMSWLFDLALQAVSQVFGETVGRDKPWWVTLIADLGCFLALLVVAGGLWLVFELLRP
jgi:hypothetical protein